MPRYTVSSYVYVYVLVYVYVYIAQICDKVLSTNHIFSAPDPLIFKHVLMSIGVFHLLAPFFRSEMNPRGSCRQKKE